VKQEAAVHVVPGMKRQVFKHSSAIQIGSKDEITLVQRKAYNVLLACAYDDLPKKSTHRMPVSDLCRYLNFSSNNTKHLKDALRGLVNTKVEWNILGADRKQTWGVAALLGEVKIENGFCYWEYTSSLRKMLYNPTVYARINLQLQNKIKSKHSLILYENIFYYYRAADGFGETPWIVIANLRKLLGIPDKKYKQFKIFNNAVIKKAVDEINAKTDLVVTIEYKRANRIVTSVKFYVKLKHHPEEAKGLSSSNALKKRLITTYGIKPDKAAELVKSYSPSHIAENLAIVDEDHKNGKVKGLAGYTINAILEDYRKDRKPPGKKIPVYEGMQVIYQGKEYIVDSAQTIMLENGSVLAHGRIIEKIKSGKMRVLELLLYPGIKLNIDGKIRTIKNAYGEPVIKDDDLYLSEKELKTGIKEGQYIIFEYPEMEIAES
jgi:plasmid replication initiation protein